jgi:hypothetical protein
LRLGCGCAVVGLLAVRNEKDAGIECGNDGECDDGSAVAFAYFWHNVHGLYFGNKA